MDLDTLLEQHSLTHEEYDRIVATIGREPNLPELGIFSVMWSEHCSYKSSKIYLKNFPTESDRVLQGPGENAGIMNIGNGLAVAFKMESHNHPSFIEPYQGAATGVGGILRDIFTMGARPIANLNSLRFGDIAHEKTPHLLSGVVAGIGGYGNCVGIPTVGGETCFDPCYNGNILVNAFTLGLVEHNRIFKGTAHGVGNKVIIVGSKTGRDGIHGATMASDVFDEESEAKRPTVQVGDPFTEKKLLEACLEVFQTDWIVGIQDMGAAGITCSTFEMSSKGESGMRVDLNKVPLREEKMTPYEILLSESQERMLLVAKPGHETDILNVFKKWELDAEIIGEVIAEERVICTFGGEVVVDLPTAPVVHEAPVYQRPISKPQYLESATQLPAGWNQNLPSENEMLLQLLGSPNIASKKWIWRQYDHMVMTNSLTRPGGDAAVLRVKETNKRLAITVDGKHRFCYLNPYLGAMHTIAEAARNLSCVGAEPIGITDCLNFGSAENPEVMWQFKEVCAGLSEACRAFGTPVTGGNVSLYNETEGQAIYPTPTVDMVGLIETEHTLPASSFVNKGDIIYLLGNNTDEIGASEWGQQFLKQACGEVPQLDVALEKQVQAVCRQIVQQNLATAVHDVSEGGLAVALAEMTFAKELGATIQLNDVIEVFPLLFGEAPSRIILTVAPEQEEKLIAALDVPYQKIGSVGGAELVINNQIQLDVKAAKDRWQNFPNYNQ